MKKFAMKKLSEKTVYSILWGCTIAAAGVVILLTVFAVARRSEDEPIITRPFVQTSGGANSTSPAGTKPANPTTTGPEQNSGPVGADTLVFSVPASGLLAKGHVMETLVYSMTMNDYRTHAGVDIEAQIGDPVFACADGQITGVYTDPLMGSCIEITHPTGYKSVYRNLAEELPEGIAEGVSVKSGSVIAAVGETARIEIADETHLHFELYRDNVPVNPVEVIADLQAPEEE